VTAPDPFRPRWHFTPQKNWINDPNGLIWIDGRWHMFYQYNPEGNQWGHMSWGHASSADLLHWDEHDVAIAEDDAHWIFSGSAVYDAQNSSGLGTADNPPLIALYTGAGREEGAAQVQCLAYSLDRGISWAKYAGNPVLDISMADFRDPKIIWHDPTNRWVMVVARAKEDRLSFYTSPNLVDWAHASDFGPAGAEGHLWECPDLIELPIDGDTAATRWILKVDFCHGDDNRGCSGQAFFGQFDGAHFTPDLDEAGQPRWQRLDEGPDFYAAMSWYGAPAGDARRIWIGWMNNHSYSRLTPTGEWRGMMSVPRVLGLRREGALPYLTQNPVAEYEGAMPPAFMWDGTEMPITNGIARIDGSLSALGSGETGFTLSWGNAAHLDFCFDKETSTFMLDRSASGDLTDNRVFARIAHAPRIASGAVMPFHLILDRCSVEIFIDGGLQVFSAQIFPPDGDPVLSLIRP
jgi:fructan beta-fructosidase